jgi:hypothetical protein
MDRNTQSKGRDVLEADASYELRVDAAAYRPFWEHEKAALSHENAFFWNNRI